ncbi:hypothetical protein [Burkholderia ambifaria]|uniref:hypothetical protein n=1 Tax=Burkholderia ambifaria TaxID=152480 RepID=UPI00158DCFC5|nr:hypothetical protein [Burkholderia ambifaria]UEP50851.1 hypothetical protein LMA00_28095 [Burkholderia ambifaria]
MFIAACQETRAESVATSACAIEDYVPVSSESKGGFTMLRVDARALRERRSPHEPAVNRVPFS